MSKPQTCKNICLPRTKIDLDIRIQVRTRVLYTCNIMIYDV